MRTNKLFVCQYCVKTLSCKRSVQCHTKVEHGADTPVMYREIFADPRDVDSLLGKNRAKNMKCINSVKDTKVVKVIYPDPVHKVTELVTGLGATELSSDQEVAKIDNQEVRELDINQEVAELATSQEVTEFGSGQEVTEFRSGLVVTADKSKSRNKLKNKSDKKEKISSYDFRKLSNVFSLPVPAQVQVSSHQNQYVKHGEKSSMDIRVEQFGDQSLGGDYPQKDSPQIQLDQAIHIHNKSLRFKVPYSKKTLRGKCRDWINCENCSRVADCKECKFCLNSHLK